MRVGSLVILETDFISKPHPGERYPTFGVIYTVRELVPTRFPLVKFECIRLEEIINPPRIQNQECAFAIERFREIQPPMTVDISELQHKTHTV